MDASLVTSQRGQNGEGDVAVLALVRDVKAVLETILRNFTIIKEVLTQ